MCTLYFGPIHFLLNLYFLCVFLKLKTFFLDEVDMVKAKAKRRFKCYLGFTIFIMLLTQVRYYVYS